MQRILHFARSLRTRYQNYSYTTPQTILISAVIISLAIIAHGALTGGSQSKAPATYFAGKTPGEQEFVYGNEKSKVVLVEYSDTECPYCVSLHPTITSIVDTYKEKIGFVYRHFPLTSIHPGAEREAQAITCAGNLGGKDAYYGFMKTLFDTKYAQKTTTLPADTLVALAVSIGLDKNAFLACEQDQAVKATVQASTAEGVQAGVNGTPASFVLLKTRKGYEVIASISGAQSSDIFKAAIEEALAR